jgi:large subunit ribosomal protein L18
VENSKRKGLLRQRRAIRKRKKYHGTAERPRLSVSRSLKNIYTQLIDDAKRVTLLSVSSKTADVAAAIPPKTKKSAVATIVGTMLGEKTKSLGIKRVVFDIGPYKYHGRVKALAEGFLKSGVKF